MPRAIDTRVEQVISDYLDSYLYSRLDKKDKVSVTRHIDKESQLSGIDVSVLYDNGTKYLIDEKAAVYYINKQLNTFSFELSFIDRANNLHEGWFLDDKLLTTHYMLLYVTSRVDDVKTITKDDIQSIECVLISKEKLKLHYERDMNYINEMTDWIRNSRMSGKTYSGNNSYYFYFSDNLKERPVNIIIKRTMLEELAKSVFVVYPDRLQIKK